MASADTILVEPVQDKAASRYASRKWLLVLLAIIVGTAMEWFGKLTPQLVGLLQWVVGLYCGFNVSQKAVEWVASKFTSAGS